MMRHNTWIGKLKNKLTGSTKENEKAVTGNKVTAQESKTGPDLVPAKDAQAESLGSRNLVKEVACRYSQFPREKIWAFNSGHDGESFRGNPKYLFVYINRYRPDIRAFWFCKSPKTLEQVRSLGFDAYAQDSPEAQYLFDHAGVLVSEQVKTNLPENTAHMKYLNLWHGVGFKRIERRQFQGDIAQGLAKKYIMHNSFYRNHQLLCVTSSVIEKEFMKDCGVEAGQLIRSGYLRCEYQQNYEPVVTFDHDLRGKKGLSSSAGMIVYAPTFRPQMGGTFAEAMQDLEALYECCKRNNLLLIFKVHPNMEEEPGFIHARETFGERKHFLFWDNQDDFYEIMDQIDMAIIDYSSILSDMVAVGIKHYIRYVYDFEEYMETGPSPSDYEARTCGRICRTFPELLAAIDHYREDDYEEDIERINSLFWEYSRGAKDFERTINRVMEYEISDRTYPTLYSFDIFDTLISRKVLDPFGIFYYVRERMEQAGGFPRSLVKNYPSIRHTAEFNVREYYRKSTEERGSDRVEITYDLIFERLADVYNLSDKQIKDLMDWELAAELEHVIPLPDRIQMVKDLVKQGETVVLISDMYLPASFIRKMIVKADRILGELPLFVSSEYGVQKTSGDLFFEVYKSFEPFYDFGKWIHYGDNEKGDQIAPRRLGICTRKVKRPAFSPFEQDLVREVDTADSYLAAALMARMCQDNTRARDRFVINFVSLCMVPYIDWVLEDSMRRGYETLYFISRDGHPLKRIADAMIRERNLPLKTKYIYASRRTWRIPSFIHEIDDGFWRPYGNFNGVTSKDSLLRAMGLDEETFASLFPAIDLSRIDWTDKKEVKGLTGIFRASEEYRACLLERAAAERPPVSDYLKQEINPNEKFAVVEYWGRGFTQDCMVRLWQDIVGNDDPVAFYYSRSVEPSVEGSIRYNFTTNDSKQLFVECIFANMPYKSIESYEEKDGRLSPVIVPCKYDRELYQSMEELLPEFAHAYAALPLSSREDTARMLYEFILNYQKNHENDPEFAAQIGSLVDASAVFGRKREFAPPYTMEDLDLFEAKIKGRSDNPVSSSVIMSFLRSEEDVQERYLDMYQILPGDELDGGRLLSQKEREDNKVFQEKYNKLYKTGTEFKHLYQSAAENLPVEDKITFVVNSKGIKGTTAEGVYKILEEEGSFCLETAPLSKVREDLPAFAKLLASSAYIIITDPLPEICMVRFRKETRLVMLCKNAFPLYNQGFQTDFFLKWKVKYRMLAGQNDISVMQIPAPAREEFFSKNYLSGRTARCDLMGCCSTDVYFDKANEKAAKEKLLKLYPETADKKVLLYMPSPRPRKECKSWCSMLDMESLGRLISGEYYALVYLGAGGMEGYDNIVEIEGFSKIVTKEMNIRELLMAADVIVGDYRDTFFEAALLHKPMFSTAFDYEKRIRIRNMSMNANDFERFLFCPLVSSSEELAAGLSNLSSFDYGPMEEFCAYALSGCDGNSAGRAAKYLINERTSKP